MKVQKFEDWMQLREAATANIDGDRQQISRMGLDPYGMQVMGPRGLQPSGEEVEELVKYYVGRLGMNPRQARQKAMESLSADNRMYPGSDKATTAGTRFDRLKGKRTFPYSPEDVDQEDEDLNQFYKQSSPVDDDEDEDSAPVRRPFRR